MEIFNPKMGTFLPFLSQSNLGAKLYPMTEQLRVFKLVLTALHIREYRLEKCGQLFLDRKIARNSFWKISVNNLLITSVHIVWTGIF